MLLRGLRRRLRCGFGPRSLLLDLVYLCVCVSVFFLVTNQLGWLKYSDAKAIVPPGVIQSPEQQQQVDQHEAVMQGRQGGWDGREEDEEKKEDAKKQEVEHDGEEDERGVRKQIPEEVHPVIPAVAADVHKQKVAVVPPPVPQQLQQQRMDQQQPRAAGQEHQAKARNQPSVKMIDGHKYPQLSPSGSFIPQRRIVHLDLKGAPYKVEVFTELFYLLNRMKATGILIEWEDMFPYTGTLASAVNGNAYTMEQVDQILTEAKRHHLEIVPLVQTFAHLEWILKLEPFVHLRDEAELPQVLCIGKDEAWKLIQDMVEQVGKAHEKHGMPFFHIGCDEVFSMGFCNETKALYGKHGQLKERVTLYHIGRVAEFVKNRFKTMPLVWHDMLAQSTAMDVETYRLPELLEPVIWSYAEDLDMYLPQSTWEALRPFPRVWGSSAYKGADGPMRFHSNPLHYVRNHESWTRQFTRNYADFEYIQGVFMTGWSRYDHLAVLAELLPVGIPSLALCMETLLEGRPMIGRYPATQSLLQCAPSLENGGFSYGCQFPGRKIYELVNDFVAQRRQLRKYAEEDYEINGWLSSHAEKYTFSSPYYIKKIVPFLEYHQLPLERLYGDLKKELSKLFFDDAVAEFLETYIEEDVMFLRKKMEAARKIVERPTFEKRPFVKPKTEL